MPPSSTRWPITSTFRDPLLKQIATALPPDLLRLTYELAMQAPQPRYHLRSKSCVQPSTN